MGSGASSSSGAGSHQPSPPARRNVGTRGTPAPPRLAAGAGFWCHACQVIVDQLAPGGVCPRCRGGFVEEAAAVAVLAQAARWLAGDRGGVPSTEVRIARLLDDLHAHLEMVEGLHETMRRTMDARSEVMARRNLDPAPQEVVEAIEVINLDSSSLKGMRQTAQCVICCADFEIGEQLSLLPGCGHLFHSACVQQWLERASNCPICRQDLVEAVSGQPRAARSAQTQPQPWATDATPPVQPLGVDVVEGVPISVPAALVGQRATTVASRRQSGTLRTNPTATFCLSEGSSAMALPGTPSNVATSSRTASPKAAASGRPSTESRSVATPRQRASSSSVLMGAGSAALSVSSTSVGTGPMSPTAGSATACSAPVSASQPCGSIAGQRRRVAEQ
mmetsp:Transcript_49940/g.99121  ORF Transcript_49940/g.99121 Transcript_49940/m.99121 type:complete len:391 (-) Transcript_49940:16-1188(-)